VPSKSGEFYTFDEVLKNLHIDEQKLKRLVSEGEIRAFREGDEMKFKKSDIEGLDVGATEDGETRAIDLSAGGGDASETLTDDLIFDEGDELDLTADDAGMATAEISSQDTFVDEGGEPVGMSTEPLDFSEEGFEEEEEEEEVEAAPVGISATRRPSARVSSRAARYEEKTGGADILMCVVLGLSLIIMLFAGFTVYSASSSNGVNSLSAIPVRIFDNAAYKVIEPTLNPTQNQK
jgi:excisionase family DNA binding protein